MSDESIRTALAKAQGQMKAAVRDRINPHYKYKYPTLDSVIDAIRKPFADNNLSFTHIMRVVENYIFLICTLHHVSGEYFDSTYPLGPVNTKHQELGSALTYGRRYTLSAIAGIAADEDDDAELASKRNGAPVVKEPTPISPQQLQEMADLMDAVGADVQKFLDYANVLRLADINTVNYDGLMDTLREKGKRGHA